MYLAQGLFVQDEAVQALYLRFSFCLSVAIVSLTSQNSVKHQFIMGNALTIAYVEGRLTIAVSH